MEATLEAQNAPERQKWLACWVVLLVSWLRRSTSVLWRLRAPRFWTIAITSLSTAARRVGRGCQEAILANCPAHQRIDRDAVDTFLRSLGSLLITPMSRSNFTMYSFEIFTPDDNKFTGVRKGFKLLPTIHQILLVRFQGIDKSTSHCVCIVRKQFDSFASDVSHATECLPSGILLF